MVNRQDLEGARFSTVPNVLWGADIGHGEGTWPSGLDQLRALVQGLPEKAMRKYLGEPHGPMATDQAAKRLAMQKMAFEVAWRILRVTPVNATALVSALLLTTGGVALTLDHATSMVLICARAEVRLEVGRCR